MTVEGFGEIAECLRRSTVYLSTGRRGQGSGFIIKPDGLIVTNAHVATSPSIQAKLWDGTSAAANLIERDEGHDVALLRVARSGLPAVTLANSDLARVGELVIAIGNPLGFMGAMTTGVVHGVGRVHGAGPRAWIQSNVRLAPGNSGGPLANAAGHVLGVNTMIAAGLGLAVPSNVVSRLVSRLVNGRDARSGLGVVARPVEVQMNEAQRLGLLLLEIAKDSPASVASLLQGDILIGIDGKEFATLDDFESALESAEDRAIRAQFLRGDRANVRTVTVRLDSQRVAAA